MKVIGSQRREKIEETEYQIDTIEGDKIMGHNATLVNSNGDLELWTENDHFAGYVIEIDGIGYEFVRSICKC